MPLGTALNFNISELSRFPVLRFSSDADLTQKTYWDLADLDVHVYDLRENVVVSLGEVPGSSKYVTRDWAARALFNCIALGQKVTMPPAP